MSNGVGSRHAARELALQCLHQWDQRTEGEGEELASQLIDERAHDAETAQFARALLRNFWDHAEEVDARIRKAAQNWTLERIAVVDRAVLRLSATELCYCKDVPATVAIDEGIELAKKFSTENSAAFVNGVLDRIRIDGEKSA